MAIKQNFDFLLALANCTDPERKKLIKEANSGQIASLLDCISVQQHLPTSSAKNKKLAKQVRKRKKVKLFLLKHHKLIRSIVLCILSKFIFESLVHICDSA